MLYACVFTSGWTAPLVPRLRRIVTMYDNWGKGEAAQPYRRVLDSMATGVGGAGEN